MEQEQRMAGTGRRKTAVFFILSGILAATWASRIPDMQARLELGHAAWGTVLFASPAGLICGLMVASWLTARFGTARIMVASTIVSAVLLVLAGMSTERIQLMIFLFLMGFTRTVLNISANTLSLDVQKHFQKPIISTFHGLWSLACFVAAGAGTFMIVANILPAYHFMIAGMICILFSILFSGPSPAGQNLTAGKKPLFVRPDKYLFYLGLIAFCAMICENTMFDWSVNYFEKAVQSEKGWVTAGYHSFIISMTIGRLAGDRIIHYFGPVKMMLFNGVLIFSGFLLAAAAPLVLTACIGFVLVGLGDSIMVPVVYALAGKSKKMPAGYAISAVTLIGYAGFLSGPLLIGLLSDILGMKNAFAIVGTFGLAISYLTTRLKRFPEMK